MAENKLKKLLLMIVHAIIQIVQLVLNILLLKT